MVRLHLIAAPGAKVSALERMSDGLLRVRIAAPAIEGKANRELVRFLAERLQVAPSRLRLVKGAGARHKTVEIEGLTAEEVERRLQLP